jgi:hypothetical protein
MSVGSNLFLHTRLNPHPPHKKSGLGAGFVFHPLVHLKSEKKNQNLKESAHLQHLTGSGTKFHS